MPQATTLRVLEDVKEDFDRLQGLYQAERGERISQSEMVARLLRVARDHEEAFLYRSDERERMTFDELLRLQASVGTGWGDADASVSIDKFLYGAGDDP